MLRCLVLAVLLVASLADASPAPLPVSLRLAYLRIPSDHVVQPPQVPSSFAAFKPIRPDFNLGFTHDRIWLLVTLTNHSKHVVSAYLTTGQRYMRPLIVYEKRDRQFRKTFSNDADSPFGDRPLALPDLTFPVQLDGNATRQMLMYVGAGGGLALNMRLQRPADVQRVQVRRVAVTTLFGGVLFTLVLINLAYYWAVRRPAHLFYALQEIMIGLYIANMQGLAFQYLWPNLPLVNNYATRLLGHGANVGVILFGIVFLDLRKLAPVLFRLSLAVLAVPASFLIFLPLIDPNLSNPVGLLGAPASGIFLIVCSIWAIINGNRSAIYFLAGWLCLECGIVFFELSLVDVIARTIAPIEWLTLGALGEAFALLLGLFDQVRRLNVQYDDAQQALVQTLQSRLQEAQHSLQVEEERDATARALSETEHLLAVTSHDVSQPIYALRLVLMRIARKLDDAHLLESLSGTLDYMEAVLHGGLTKGSATVQALPSTYGELFRQIVEEHTDEATESSIHLNYVPSSVSLDAAVVPLRRVLHNLVANAIRHSKASRLTLGLRRGADFLRILIIDNGVGLSHDGAPDPPHGTGLGLAIVEDICSEQGWTVEWNAQTGKGTHFTIGVPA